MRKPVHTSAPASGETLVARALREALEAIASPEVSRRVIDRALHMARVPEVPAGGADLRVFVTKHLRKAAEFALGDENAEALVRDLQPIVRMADDLNDVSRVRDRDLETVENTIADAPAPPSLPAVNLRNPKVPKAPPPGISAPIPRQLPTTQPPEDDDDDYWEDTEIAVRSETPTVPAVLIATLDADRLNRLASHLTGDATVQLIGDVVELLEALQGVMRPVVVIDCMSPSIQPATIATVAPDLPEGSAVVLWGAGDSLFHQVESLADSTRRWLRCGVDATTDDVASLVAMLVA